MGEELAVEAVEGRDCAVVRLSGPLSQRAVPQINGGLGKELVNRGCVVVDLRGLRLEWQPAVTAFVSILDHAGGWPAARMVLFGADGELAAALDRSRVTRSVPLVADLLAAIERVRHRPDRVRRYGDLPAEPAAARAARALVREACVDWEVPIGTENAAAMIVSELAMNAVVHAKTPLRVCVELSDEALWVSVRDLRPGLPSHLFSRVPDCTTGPERVSSIHGLHVVAGLARKWGVTEQPDAKIVWAQLPLRDGVAIAPADPS